MKTQIKAERERFFSQILSKLPSCDPLVYWAHRFSVGHSSLERAFNVSRRPNNDSEIKVKFEDTTEYKRSIFIRNVMQASALLGAAVVFFLGYVSSIFHSLFHSLNVSFYGCLFLCLLTGHIIGMALGLGLACCSKEYFVPTTPAETTT